MAKVKKTVWFFQCERCGYEWLPREEGVEPAVCPNPKCKSPYWNRPRRADVKAVAKAKATKR
jgi:hypothetical protein